MPDWLELQTASRVPEEVEQRLSSAAGPGWGGCGATSTEHMKQRLAEPSGQQEDPQHLGTNTLLFSRKGA